MIQIQASGFFIMSSNAVISGHLCLKIFFFILLLFVVNFINKLPLDLIGKQWSDCILMLFCIYAYACVRCSCVFSCVWRFATTWTVANQAPLSMGFSRQEYWSGCRFLLQGPMHMYVCKLFIYNILCVIICFFVKMGFQVRQSSGHHPLGW